MAAGLGAMAFVVSAPPASGAPGDLDTTFGGGDGIATAPLTNPPGVAKEVVVQPDGKIVVLNQLPGSAGFDTLIRVNADGSPDLDFNADGDPGSDFNHPGTVIVDKGFGENHDLVLMADGSIVVVGQTSGGKTVGHVRKFTAAGERDTGFGDNGVALVFAATPEGYVEFFAAYEQDGRIIAVGAKHELDNASGFYTTGVLAMRFLANGTPDPSYGSGGQVWSADREEGSLERFELAGIAPQPDGSVLVAAELRFTGGGNLYAYRIGPGATVTPLHGGESITGIAGADFTAVAPLAGGGMLVGGSGVTITPGQPGQPVRVLQNVTAAGEPGPRRDEPSANAFRDLALLPNGAIAAAASDEDNTTGTVEVRNSVGELDAGFAGDGVAEGLIARGVAAAPGGKVVAVGGPLETADVRRYLAFVSGPAPLAPARILDTRTGVGYSGPKPGAGATITVAVAGHGGVPATGAAAVVMNVTATEADGPGFVTVWPSDQPQPNASNLNLDAPGQTIPNLVTVPLAPDGTVKMFTYGGAHLLADVAAWYPAGSGFTALTPTRILDTRTGLGSSAGKPAAGSTVNLAVVGQAGIPSTATAVVLNVTVTEADAAGFVTVWPTGSTRPNASNLNVEGAGQTIPNHVMVPIGAGGAVSLFTYEGAHLLADVAGYFTAGSGFHALTPARILDTRAEAGPIGYTGAKPGANATVPVQVAGHGGVPATGATAVVMNVTATQADAPGFVTAWPGGSPQPNASNLNLDRAGQTIANLVVVPVGPNGTVNLFTLAGAHLVADVAGWIG